MTPVKFHFITADGEPFANQSVQINLPKAGYGGDATEIVLPQQIQVETDAEGKAQVDLYPVTQHPYTVEAVDWKTGIRIQEIFYVPDSAVPIDLRDIVLLPAPNTHPFDEEAIQSITQDKVDAQQAHQGAELAQTGSREAEAESKLARDASQTARGLSEEARDASRLAETGSKEARDLSLQYRNTANEYRAAALLSEQKAAGHEEQAGLDRTAVAEDRIYIDGRVTYVDGRVAHVESQVVHVDGQRSHVDAQTQVTDQRASAALASEQKAAQWASAGEDVVVEPGLFSAYHGATKAAASEAGAAALEITTNEHRIAAAASEQSAYEERLLARDWAVSVGEIEPGLKSAREYAKDAKASLATALKYQGPWDASTGVYPSSDLATGDMWKIQVAGEIEGVMFRVGDHLIHNALGGWDHIDNTESVTSVGGGVGEITDAHLLAAVKRVAGEGSGLDADALDGKQLTTIETEYKSYADQSEANAKQHADTGLATKVDKTTYTATDVLNKVKTVHGSGSGLNADLLDGKELATLEQEQQSYADNAAVTAETRAKRYADDQAFIMALIFG